MKTPPKNTVSSPLVAILAAGVLCALFSSGVPTFGGGMGILFSIFAPLPLLLLTLYLGFHGAVLGGIIATGVNMILLMVAGDKSPLESQSSLLFILRIVAPALTIGYALERLTAIAAAKNIVIPQYPSGLVIWVITLLAATSTTYSWYTLSLDPNAARDLITEGLKAMVSTSQGMTLPAESVINRIANMLSGLMGIAQVLTYALNAIVASAIWKNFHKNALQPAPVHLPPILLILFAGAVITATLANAQAGQLAYNISLTLAPAFAIAGLSLLHTISLTLPQRSVFLAVCYFFLLAQPYALVLLVGVGIADTLFNLRTLLTFLTKKE